MKYIKLLWFDIRQGLLRKPLLFAIPIIVSLIACFDLVGRVSVLNNFDYFGENTQAGFADFIMYIYGGMDQYTPDSGNPFRFPVRWIVVLLSIAFITLNYPYKDMHAYGQQILVRTKGRTVWWFSKCSWNILSVIVYHGLIFLTVISFCVFTNRNLTGTINKDLLYTVFQTEIPHIAPGTTIWTFTILLSPVFVSVGINLLQMMVSLFIKPMFGFLVTAFLMISSAYFTSPYLIGNYAMPMRYDVVIIDGVSASAGILISAILALAVVVIGSIKFHRYDIMN